MRARARFIGAGRGLRARLLEHDDSLSLPGNARTTKSGAALCVKMPLVYTSVAPRNWQAFKALGVAQVYAPGSYFSRFH